MDSALNRFLLLLMLGVPAGLIVAFAVGRWLAGVALTPLTRLADATPTIDIDGLRRRLPLRGARDELDAVAQAFNDTLARLEQTVGEMRQFSAALAHELRTPLAALRGEIELTMLQARPTDDVRRLEGQLEEIDRLKALIERILMLARAEAGEIPLTVDAVDLGALAASLVDQLGPVAQAKGVVLQCECAEHVVVQGDADWLERLILNLLDNAIKFTSDGGHVLVSVWREATAGRLAVRDTGIGIDPALTSRIFERFFRADPARAPGSHAVGLGLSLAKWIVERHHGRIDVESTPGRGSTFTVSFPARR